MSRPRGGAPRRSSSRSGPHEAGRRGGARASAAASGPAGTGEGGDYLRHLVELGRDPSRWESLDPDALSLIAFQQALYHGAHHDADSGASLAALYAHLVTRVMPEDRLELLERVGEAVQSGATTVLAMLPFLQRETDAHVAQMAAVSFASLMPLTDDDPMTGPRTLRTLFEHSEEEAVRVGLLAGLLALGDRRVLPLLPSAWDALTAQGQIALMQATQPFVSALFVEFLADQLGRATGEVALAVAARLTRVPAEGEGRVLDLERKFPENVIDERPEIALLGEWETRIYGERIAARLEQAASLEGCAWDVAAVRSAWGIRGA